MGIDRQLLGEVTVTQDFHPVSAAIRQAGGTQSGFVYPSTLIEPIERFEVYREIMSAVANVIESPFGNTPDQWHLAAFKADTNGTAGSGGLTFATAAAGFAVTGGFALTKALAAMLGTGPGFEIV
jgi:hypothetical protein